MSLSSLRNVAAGRHAAASIVCVTMFLVASGQPAAAYPRPGRTERVSVSVDGGEGEFGFGYSLYPAVSADGRYVSFSSNSSNLVPGDTNGTLDIFVRDRVRGTIERVSVASDGTQANAFSNYSAVSADGRYVAVVSHASNLVPGDTNGASDVFLRDRSSGLTERISVASDGTEANTPPSSFSLPRPAISADGRYVAFVSNASNLVPGDTNGTHDVFVRDRTSGTTERISVAGDDTEGNSSSSFPAISADGRYVAFGSNASNLVPGDTNGTSDVFVRHRASGVTERISVASDGTEGNSSSSFPAISADGRHVAFGSSAFNLVPSDTNGVLDVFVHDRATGIPERVSMGSDGTEMNSSSASPASTPAISADGRYVAFGSWTEVGPVRQQDDSSFLRDRATGTTERISVASDGTVANSNSVFSPAISADGRYVAFTSNADNLVPGDTNGTSDVFVRDGGPAVGVGEVSARPEGERISVSGWATLSGQEVASAADPPDDGTTPGTEPAGAELTGISLTYRPEREDLFLRLRLASLPGPLVGGAPAVLYGLEFDREGVAYEVRALRVGGSGVPPATPLFALYRCEMECIEEARLSGGIGTSGTEVVVSIPLSALGADERAVLKEVRAFTALGEAAPGAVATLDQINLPDATIPAAHVSLGIAPAGTPESEVAFDTEAGLAGGSFSGTLDVSSLPSGEYGVWARACLGDVCGPATFGEVAL